MDNDAITFDEIERLERARRAKENPWTAADDDRVSAKSKLEQERNEAWAAAHPQPEETDDAEESDRPYPTFPYANENKPAQTPD